MKITIRMDVYFVFATANKCIWKHFYKSVAVLV